MSSAYSRIARSEENLRARLMWLLERARVEAEARRYPSAVAAVELALDERPERALSQKLLHRHRDLKLIADRFSFHRRF